MSKHWSEAKIRKMSSCFRCECAFCTIWRQLMEDLLSHTYRTLIFPAKLLQSRGCCFGLILLQETFIGMKCWGHWVLFLPSAMPAKGLVHCQMQPQINANEILWAISVITLWCQQRWSTWLNGDFILHNPSDLCLESLLVCFWSDDTIQ